MQKSRIEWCDATWNPVTGCNHGCEYCYARRIAERFGGWTTTFETKTTLSSCEEPAELKKPMLLKRKDGKTINAPFPFGFAPTLHRYRLDEPYQQRGQNIFVCSMADLFGEWVPTKWIVEVLDACLKAPQHRYLFLTKNPKRYVELDHLALLPREDNFWYGSTVTMGEDAAAWMRDVACHWFLSIEPLLGPVDLTAGTGRMPEWVIIGAETGNRAEKVAPEWEWVRKIVSDCKTFGIPVFMKDSIGPFWGIPILTEFPWEKVIYWMRTKTPDVKICHSGSILEEDD